MDAFVKPILRFIQREINSGIVLMFATVAALIVANSGWADTYFRIFEETTVDFKFELWSLSKPLYYWINDGLMGLFFFVIGLEVKREIKIGELSTLSKAMLPTAAAVGGMLIPAVLYAAANLNGEHINGWAIPMATDIAFAMGVIALLGKRVPVELKIFLTSLAVVDDIGAVLTIAVFYTEDISFYYLITALAVWLILFAFNKVGVRALWVYIVIGIFGVWYPLLKSGVHATIAGVLVAFTIPMTRKYAADTFVEKVKQRLKQFKEHPNPKNQTLLSSEQYDSIDDIRQYCDKVSSPLQNMEHALHKFTFYFIMPLFAFANTGIRFEDFDFGMLLGTKLPLGIFLGLALGKVIGISLFVYVFLKLKVISLPESLTFSHVIGVGFLAGIGFTMSIFITELAFHNHDLIIISKVSILLASLFSGIVGYVILRMSGKNDKTIPQG